MNRVPAWVDINRSQGCGLAERPINAQDLPAARFKAPIRNGNVRQFFIANGGLALNGNPNRAYLLVQNVGAGTLYLAFGQEATPQFGLRIPPNWSYEPWGFVPTNQVYISGSQAVIVEG